MTEMRALCTEYDLYKKKTHTVNESLTVEKQKCGCDGFWVAMYE